MKKRGLSILLAAALTLSLPAGVQAEENFQGRRRDDHWFRVFSRKP